MDCVYMDNFLPSEPQVIFFSRTIWDFKLRPQNVQQDAKYIFLHDASSVMKS